MSYYINLSFLSNTHDNPHNASQRKLLTAEARRILKLSEGITEDDIAEEAGGRPFSPNRNADFSISHSGNLVAVSVVRGKNIRTGCDVELVRPRAKAKEIAETFFTAGEREYIEANGIFDNTRFYQIWTLKECYLKLRGLSVFDMASTPSFVNGEGSLELIVADPSPISFYLYELMGNEGEQYILATAITGAEAGAPEIRCHETHERREEFNHEIHETTRKNKRLNFKSTRIFTNNDKI